jgi:hypothetical protein
MADAGEDLRSYIVADSTINGIISTRCFQNTVPETATLPFIWFVRRGVEFLEILGEAESTPYREYYDFECVSDEVDQAIDLADAVRARLQGTSGSIGAGTYQWVDVTDQSDTYIPRNIADDERLTIASLAVEVINQ